jgi:hypothetical protein
MLLLILHPLCCTTLQEAVQQANLVLQAMLAELSSEARLRLLTSTPPSKVALFKRPEQVWTDVPEHSIFKGGVYPYEFSGGQLGNQLSRHLGCIAVLQWLLR